MDLLYLGPAWGYVRPSWSYVGPSWGHVDPSWGYVAPSWGYVGPSWGLCWPIFGLCWPILGAMLAHVGPMLAHPQAYLGPCWPLLNQKIRKTAKNGKSTKHRKTRDILTYQVGRRQGVPPLSPTERREPPYGNATARGPLAGYYKGLRPLPPTPGQLRSKLESKDRVAGLKHHGSEGRIGPAACSPDCQTLLSEPTRN